MTNDDERPSKRLRYKGQSPDSSHGAISDLDDIITSARVLEISRTAAQVAKKGGQRPNGSNSSRSATSLSNAEAIQDQSSMAPKPLRRSSRIAEKQSRQNPAKLVLTPPLSKVRFSGRITTKRGGRQNEVKGVTRQSRDTPKPQGISKKKGRTRSW
jgi:hypothetical protein